MDRIWQAHWPPGVDEARIRLPDDSLPRDSRPPPRALPRKTALVFYGREISFAELDEASDRFAAWLRGRGVGPGDRVALYLENCPQFAVAHFGALKVGAITVALNPMHKAHELGHELEDSGARVIVAADAGREVVESVRDRTALDTAVLVSYRDYLPEEPTLPLPPSLREEAPRRPRGWEDFQAIVGSAATAPRARAARASRHRADPVHLGHHRRAQGRRADPRQRHRQLRADPRLLRHQPRPTCCWASCRGFTSPAWRCSST